MPAFEREQLHDGSIDAGLYLLAEVTPKGRTWTHREIAFVCGCSRSLIWLIEQSAKEKLRKALARRGYRSYEDIFEDEEGQ